jgi:tetratricopeptide (TPR) repeat protein
LARRHDEAVAELKKTLELDPHFVNAHNHLGLNYLQQKKYDEALAEFKQLRSLTNGDHGAIETAWVLAAAGQRSEAERIYGSILSKKEYESPVNVAAYFTALGDPSQAIRKLNEGFDWCDALIVVIRVDSVFDPLRKEPRFLELLHRMNLSAN